MSVNPAVIRARALLGVPFRLHGRTAETGLDCVGLVAVAHDRTDGVPNGYAMRGGPPDHWEALLDKLLVRATSDTPEPGDVILMQVSPAQFHCGLWTGSSVIHADIRLRRVVETPGLPLWPILGVWRRKCEGISSWPH